ncbi:MAG TPA: hypothetical protein VME86_02230 [Acidobacteriaceae bacterium]|nr:hypothetical protein [Acidobacteriaceae bacterium]
MYRKLSIYTLSGLLTLGIAAGAAFAQDNTAPPPQNAPMPMHGHHRMSPEQQLQHMTKQLDLTSDQQSQIKPILESRQQQMQALWQDQSLTQQDRHQKMRAIQQDSSSKIESVLNDTQKQKYEAMMAQMREHRMHHGMGGNMPPPDNSSQPPQQ